LRGICKTDFAMYGLKAIQMAKLKTYRLILMDINLGPGIDGLETAREIRKIPGCEKTPIVAVTGFTLLGERDRLLEGGCTHYIPKPFDQSTLIDLCKQILNE
jgi:CheY-like chemotaxis protein